MVLVIIKTLTSVYVSRIKTLNPATYLYSQSTGTGAPQFYGLTKIDMGYTVKSQARQNAIVKKKEGIGLFRKGASSAESVLRG